jgi:hypothetical protein
LGLYRAFRSVIRRLGLEALQRQDVPLEGLLRPHP